MPQEAHLQGAEGMLFECQITWGEAETGSKARVEGKEL
jgi:hypothetical protein